MYRIHQIKLKVGEGKERLPILMAKKLKIKREDITKWNVIKESIDARDKSNLKMVYSVDFESKKNLDNNKACEVAPDMTYHQVEALYPKEKTIAIVGFGPCGMFAALTLAEMGYKPVVFERGRSVDDRSKDVETFWQGGPLNEESNVQFGEGGAGTFSDGKLTTGIKDKRIRKVLEDFNRFGAPEDILYKHKPHIGTDVLKKVVKNLREEVKQLGGQVKFSSRVSDIIIEDNQLKALVITNTDQYGKDLDTYQFPCDKAVFAMGHSARDTFRCLNEKGVEMKQKPFSIGVRIEHPQEMINKAQFGTSRQAGLLGAAEYKLNCRTKDGRGVYTFCMCPGGVVVMASSREGQVVTNGMSYRARDGKFANSGLLVDVRCEDFGSDNPLAGVDFQERYERKAYEVSGGYEFPTCTFKEFKNSKLAQCLPEFAVDAIIEALPVMGKKLKGFDSPDAIMKGVETRSSSPVRFTRYENFNSTIKNLYPGGEGAGYAGGIVSSAVDGIKLAEIIASCKE